MSKTDPTLGAKVHAHLLKHGVETPMIDAVVQSDNQKKIEKLTSLFTDVWVTLGMDLSDDSLQDTPARMAKMYVNEIYYGLSYDLFPKCTAVENKMHYNEMLIERDISVQSNCEHHGVVIDGSAVVAYMPGDKVVGLSKINRIVEFFSKRPQIQERLTEQVFHALCFILGTDDVAVTIDAAHYCVKSRGVRDQNSSTVTSRLGGRFLTNAQTRAEFFSLANRSSK